MKWLVSARTAEVSTGAHCRSVAVGRTKKLRRTRSVAAFEEVAKRNHRCPVTNKPFKDSDVLQLKSGSSSFAAKGKVEATKYNPIAL